MPKLGPFVSLQLSEAEEPLWATTTLLFADKKTIPGWPNMSDLAEKVLWIKWNTEFFVERIVLFSEKAKSQQKVITIRF